MSVITRSAIDDRMYLVITLLYGTQAVRVSTLFVTAVRHFYTVYRGT